MNNQANTSASASNANNPIPPPAAAFPGASFPAPPFFFPPMPFMAPYAIPPPPMPQNLDQLTIEELRAMEGNERKHVEERLKLLRNVQTLLNASATLMSQYQMVVANLPPVPIPNPPAASTSSAEAAPATESKAKPDEASTSKEASTSQVKLEDIGSEDQFVDLTAKTPSQPSTSKLTPSLDSQPPASSSSSSTFIANESSSTTNGESDEANEIRRRRLQKFVNSD